MPLALLAGYTQLTKNQFCAKDYSNPVTISVMSSRVACDRGKRMYPVLGKCPVCGENLTVTRLYCRSCDSALEGHFQLGRFYQLTPEQLSFVELFVRNEGRLNKVQEELGLSYPTVRSRLNDVIRSLGYEVTEEAGPSVAQRRSILEELAQGKLTPDDAVKLLQG